jgi:trimethylguanosine synthase
MVIRIRLTVSSKIAAHIAESAPKEKTVIIDAFAGVGGNAIALARSGRWERVFAIEKDPKTLKCAKHNAEIYGVANKIFWLAGDCFEAINRFAGQKNTVVFASPPWGGMYNGKMILASHGLTSPGTSYGEDDVFDLTKMEPYNLEKLYKSFTKYSNEIVLYLPRNSDLNQIARYVPEGKKLEVAHYAIMAASKVWKCVKYEESSVCSHNLRLCACTLATSILM